MKNSATLMRTSVHHTQPTTIFYHPPIGKGYHFHAWGIGDLKATPELGPSIPPPLLLVPYLIPLFPQRVICQVSRDPAMAPKAACKRPASQAPEDPPGRRPSKDMKRAAETARAYKQGTSSPSQQEINEMENHIWQTVEEAQYDGQLDEFKQWVNDPGYTTGRLALYDRALAYYWTAKQLCGMVMDKKSAKETAEHEPVKCWKPHYRETHMIHYKIDAIANKLGMSFLAQDAAANLMQGGKQTKDSAPSAPPEPPE